MWHKLSFSAIPLPFLVDFLSLLFHFVHDVVFEEQSLSDKVWCLTLREKCPNTEFFQEYKNTGHKLKFFKEHLVVFDLANGLTILTILSVNPTKCSNTLKQFVDKLPTSCLSVFHHFVVLTLTGLRIRVAFNFQTDLKSSKIVLNRNTGNKLAAYKYVW